MPSTVPFLGYFIVAVVSVIVAVVSVIVAVVIVIVAVAVVVAVLTPVSTGWIFPGTLPSRSCMRN